MAESKKLSEAKAALAATGDKFVAQQEETAKLKAELEALKNGAGDRLLQGEKALDIAAEVMKLQAAVEASALGERSYRGAIKSAEGVVREAKIHDFAQQEKELAAELEKHSKLRSEIIDQLQKLEGTTAIRVENVGMPKAKSRFLYEKLTWAQQQQQRLAGGLNDQPFQDFPVSDPARRLSPLLPLEVGHNIGPGVS